MSIFRTDLTTVATAIPSPQTSATTTTQSSPNLPAGIFEGDLIRGPDGIKVWIVNWCGWKRHIFNPAVFNMYDHFKWDQIRTHGSANA